MKQLLQDGLIVNVMILKTPPPVRFIAVVGPTASGKSAVAMELAKHCRGEIVCCDSVQLYRGFDIGSAKPTREDRSHVPHHLFDEFEPDEPCDAAIYAQKAHQVIDEILTRGGMPIVTGGTGLYLRALAGENWNTDLPCDEALRQKLAQRSSVDLYEDLKARDPLRATQVHPNDRIRVIRSLEIVLLTGLAVPQPSKSLPTTRNHLVVVMDPPRAALQEAVRRRTEAMLASGLVHEVQNLLAQGVSPTAKPMSSIGYAEVLAFLSGNLLPIQLQESIEVSTRQYAKRQCTWFKKISRDFTLSDVEGFAEILPQLLERLN